MVKCEVIESFSLRDFDKLKNIVRVKKDERGKLFVGDTFECEEEMAKYLLNEIKNPEDRAFVKKIEVTISNNTVKDSETKKLINEDGTLVEEIKPKRTTRRRKPIA